MKNKMYYDENEYKRFFNTVYLRDKTEDKQFTKFLKWCFDNDFFRNISDNDISDYYIYNSFPLLKNNGVCIGGYPLSYGFLVGVDPSKCFDKTDRCSVIIQFPITSKREEEKVYKLLDTLTDNKKTQTKEWKRNAPEMMYGDYAKFGF